MRLFAEEGEGGALEVGAVGADHEVELAGLGDVAEVGGVVFEVVLGDGEGEGLGLAGLEEGAALEAFELFDGAGGAAGEVADVELEGFVAGAGAGVGEVGGEGDALAGAEGGGAEAGGGVGEGGVGEAVAEGVEGVVGDVEVFGGVFLFFAEGAAGVFVVVVDGDLAGGAGEGHGELAGGGGVPEEGLDDGF